MSKPPFSMSKYASELDLQRDARAYYENKNEEMRKLLIELRNSLMTTYSQSPEGRRYLEKIDKIIFSK